MALRSMTGYGAARFVVGGDAYQIEIRSVNHRHLDLKPKLPRELGPLESRLRETVARHVQRGHLDLNVSRIGTAAPATEVQVDVTLARQVRDALEKVRATLALAEPVTLAEVVAFQGVIDIAPRSVTPDEAWQPLAGALLAALADLDAMRQEEGARLAADLRQRADNLRGLLAIVEAALPGILADARARLSARLAELAPGVDAAWREDRLEAELAVFVDRSDASEELVRIRSHLVALEGLLDAPDDDGRGRKLEFLAVELNRELNTTASKSTSAFVTQRVVDAKAEVERIREQVANIE